MTVNHPLDGVRVLEFAGLAPGPYAGLLLADYGATVLRIDRPGPSTMDKLARGKKSLALDLKSRHSIVFILSLIKSAKVDILIDPFRPGVLEKLGLGPQQCMEMNPRLIYTRITGFRRTGKYAAMAGHDINYLAVSGALDILGRHGETPYAPVNVLGDFAGGGSMAFMGILLAMIARVQTGKGQVVEANMVDGVNHLFTFPRANGAGGTGQSGMWTGPRGTNLLDGGAPFYDTYETKDHKYMAVGCLEPHFYAVFVDKLFIPDTQIPDRHIVKKWPVLKSMIAARFKEKTRAEWESVFDGTDACVTPVLSYGEILTSDKKHALLSPAVRLHDTPARALEKDGCVLEIGEGGVQILNDWCGWSLGQHYQISDKICAPILTKSKL